MSQVAISSKGLFVLKDNKWKRAKKLSVLSYLRDNCKIKSGTTLLDIFNIVDQYKLLKLFISQYSWCRSLEEFHVQAREPMRTEEEEDEKLEYLEIYWTTELYSYKKIIDFNISTGFHGVGKKTENNPNGTFSVSYTPMYDLAHLPIKLDKNVELREPWEKGKTPKIIFEGQKEFSLQDILDAIYWDISFMGGPQENIEFIEKMKETSEGIKNGTIQTIPLEEVFNDLEPPKEGEWKITLSPEVAKQFGYEEKDEKWAD